jgi:HupE / UreJ protein
MLTGYDHLLFLFGVIFYLTSIKDVFKFVTVFTIGHSITLIAATYLGITANYYLVDAVIALSVCYKALDNLGGFKRLLGFKPPNLLGVILVFGLIHGFGLSTRLQQLPMPDHGLIWRILSFNVGVEFGQVAALAVLVLLLAGLRKTAAFKTWGTMTTKPQPNIPHRIIMMDSQSGWTSTFCPSLTRHPQLSLTPQAIPLPPRISMNQRLPVGIAIPNLTATAMKAKGHIRTEPGRSDA